MKKTISVFLYLIIVTGMIFSGCSSANKEEVEMQFEALQKKINEDLSNFEKVFTIVIIKEPWTEENDLLTPTLKVKRNKIDEKYMNSYVTWHKESSNIIWVN